MRVLIVAVTDQLPVFLSVMNPALDVCAIVADDPEPAKAIVDGGYITPAQINLNDVYFNKSAAKINLYGRLGMM